MEEEQTQSLWRPPAFTERPKKVMSQLPQTGTPPSPLQCLMESPHPGQGLFS